MLAMLSPPARPATAPRLALVHASLAQADDAAVARAAAEGHPAAAAIVWDRFSPLVRGLLRRSLGPDIDVEDHVQEVFLRFFRQVKGLRDPDALRSFLVSIAIRVSGSELRRRRVRRWLRLTESGSMPDVPDSSSGDDAREALARLYAILDSLGDEARLTFVLRHIQGLPLGEVAAALDLSLATAKRRLAFATAKVLAKVERDPVLSDYVVRGSGIAAPSGKPAEESDATS